MRRAAEQWRTVMIGSECDCVLCLVRSGVLQRSNDVPGPWPGLHVSLLAATQEADQILRTHAEGKSGLQ